MKFETVKHVPVFEPIEFKIIFESEKEINAIRRFMTYDLTIPAYYRKHAHGLEVTSEEMDIISNFMGRLSCIG